MTSLIEANNISVIRNGQVILNDVSLRIVEKDFITIIGPNGAGKSMLLKCLMGFFDPEQGDVTRKKNLKIGYVPQRLFPDHTMPITVKRFLTLRKKIKMADLEKVAHETDVRTILNKPLYVLSGGELQRALLARSLLDNPQLLILDEPAQNLDVSGQLAFYRLIDKIHKQRNITILMVSHDLHLVMASTKNVVCLFHHVCCSGKPHEVTKDPEFISLFGVDMSAMLSVYHHSHDHKHDHA